MSALHDAARRVVAAWVSTRPAWIEQCNAAVMALDAALKAQPEPAGCETEANCTSQPWCRIRGACQRKQPEPAQEPEPVSVDQLVMPLVESALQAVAEKIGDQCAVWYGIGARDVEAVLREAARYGLVRTAQPEPAQEPAGIVRVDSGEVHIVPTTRDADVSSLKDGQAVYTTPQPQRPPLTDEEIDRLWHDNGAGIDAERFARIARAIERKVRGEA